MSYEDASQAGSMDTGSAPVARPDVDALPAGSFGPASGNAITGAGTNSGAAGADQVADAPAKIVEVHGSGGPTSGSGDTFQAAGQYGVLSMGADGNFNYVRNPGTPEGVQDVFGYTLADGHGSTSSSTLTIDIGGINAALAAAQAGVVNLPQGVELSDIKVNGRDLVIQMPDGTQMVIPGGAVFVPNLVIGDVEVPPANLAALLIDSEPKPASGAVQSSGGNFADPVPPLDPGVPLGDLIPPTELVFTPPEFEELQQGVDHDPEIVIIPDGQPAAVNAVDDVFEAGLPVRGSEPEGSGEEAAAGANGDAREATSGVISIDSQDDIESVTINGEAVTAVGQVINGDQGTLTITSINLETGQIGYTYLLTDNTNPGGDNISDPFTIIVTDEDGDTATGTLTIDIIDDQPIARDDTDTVVQGQEGTNGNVLTGVDTTSGAAGRDTSGADGLPNGVTGIHAGTGGSFANVTSGGVLVHGTFGDLVIHSDGSYTYTLNDQRSAGGNDVFTYQITDGDGDVDTATLTIGVPSDNPVTINGLDGEGAEETVFEDDLPNGTSPDNANLSQAGTFSFTSPDGAASITIGGQVFTFAQLNNSGTTPLVIDGPHGNLVINGYSGTSAGGTVSYTYTLDTAVDNAPASDNFLESFNIIVADVDGSSDSASLDVNIVDDHPDAIADTNSLGEDDASVSGNVLSNDIAGADGSKEVTTPGSITGTYGDLVLGANGSYTYTLHSDPATQALLQSLTPGDTLTDTFDYTMQDGDQDNDSTTLTITINGQDDGVTISGLDGEGAEETVFENDLANGTSPDAAALSQSGTFSFVSPDGAASITIGGQVFTFAQLTNSGTTPLVIDGPHGNLVINGFTGTAAGGTVSYTYTLDTAVDNAAASDNFLESFNIVVADVDGSSDSASLDVDIIDDHPIANPDTNSISEKGTSVSGNVLPNDVAGADGSKEVTTTGTIHGTYGDLVLGSGGGYTYTLHTDPATQAALAALGNGDTLTDTFDYTMQDADNDTDSSTLTITINGSDDSVTITGLDGAGAEEMVFDNDLPLGTSPNNANLSQSGTFGFTSPDGAATITIGGQVFTFAQLNAAGTTPLVIDGPHGNLVINGFTGTAAGGTVSYTYTLDTTVANAPGSDNFIESFNIIVTDIDGSNDSASLDVDIIDDHPIAANDIDSVTEGLGHVADGNVLTGSGGSDSNSTDGVLDNVGADHTGTVTGARTGTEGGGGALTTVSGATIIHGTYGDLQINPNGSYTYTLTVAQIPGGVTGETFTYQMKDADGDVDTAQLQINFAQDTHIPNVNGTTATVFEDGLADGIQHGATSETTTGSFVVNASGEGYALTLNGATIDSVGDSVNTGKGVLTITNISAPDGSGNVTYSFSYTLSAPLTHAGQGEINPILDTINMSITDATGDSDPTPGQIVISIVDDIPTATATLHSGASVTVDESDPGGLTAVIPLGGNTAGNDEDVSGSGPISRSTSGTAVIDATVVHGADGAAAGSPTYAISVTNATSGVTTTEGEVITLVQVNATTIIGKVAAGGEHSNQVAFALHIDSTGHVTVEQYLSLDHPVNPNPNDALQLNANTISATVTATDGDGDVATSAPVDISGTITFLDDGPTMGAFNNVTVSNDAGVHGTGTFAYDPGADGHGSFAISGPALPGVSYNTVQNANGALLTATTDADGPGGDPPVTLFTLQVNQDGTYDFTLVTPDAAEDQTYSLLGLASGQNEFIQTADGLVEFTPLNHLGVDTGTVNSSGAGFGNSNQFTGNGEAVTFEFHSTNEAGNQAPGTHPDFISKATLDVPSNGFNGTAETITWYATNTQTGQTTSGTIQVTGTTQQLVFEPGFDFNVLVIEGSNADGQGIRMEQLTVSKTILPQDIDLDFSISALDGDGDPTSTSHLTVSVDADGSTLAATSFAARSFMAGDSLSLLSSNDNLDQHQHKNALKTGTDAALMGALAAAGLGATSQAAANDLSATSGPSDSNHHGSKVISTEQVSGGHDRADSSSLLGNAAQSDDSKHSEQSNGSHSADHGGDKSVSESSDAPADAPAALSQGTDAPAGDGTAQSAIISQSVFVPSAEMLHAHAGKGEGKGVDAKAESVSGEAEHNQDVGKVLADALHGGAAGPDVEALVNSLGGHGGHGSLKALEALASHGNGAVPNGDTGVFAGFTGGHGMHTMDQMAMHQDAAPQHG